ncbi:hypothetical protein [Prochlorococcus marinus]|uniref:hypothetical protein n=1 Tax=Prochlorococcus marinus TaxID=1219 RepID=UPI0022B3A9B0|nr:hypothetical protein [Prochlorococcus marinus]
MLRANFFYKFFRYRKNNSNEIVKYNANKKNDLQNQINNEIIDIDQKIAENSKALLQAQTIRLRSTFSKSYNFIEKLSTNVYKKKLEESINWHQKQIQELYLKRRELQINLEKLKGTFWLNQFKRFLTIIFLGFFIFLSIFIFLSGFMIIIYLLPLLILIFIGYLLATKKY